MWTFEQGPIRPPSEAGSLLLRFTRNCPWNKCGFCTVYKSRQFSRRSLAEIREDIDAVRHIIEDLQTSTAASQNPGEGSQQAFNRVFTDPRYNSCYRQVALWALHGRGTVFIQDANSLILPTDTLVKALRYLKERIPGVHRITSYARSSTLARKSVEELSEIHQAGLDRIHIGLESGSDQVLKFVQKGTTARQQIEAGQKVIAAGMTVSEYIMPGLGGQTWSAEHATETARVLNEINPHYIRLRSLRILPRSPLSQEKSQGRLIPLHDDEIVKEIRLFIESLEGIQSTLTSDHIMNLLEEVAGTFPQDKPHMLEVIDRYLQLPNAERLLYRLGRRGGAIRSLDDLQNPGLRSRLEQAQRELQEQTNGDLEQVIAELGNQYL